MTTGSLPLGCKKPVIGQGNSVLFTKKFVLNCLRDKEMDVKASALVESVAEIEKGLCCQSVNCSLIWAYF